jgi:hypothetical protein
MQLLRHLPAAQLLPTQLYLLRQHRRRHRLQHPRHGHLHQQNLVLKYLLRLLRIGLYRHRRSRQCLEQMLEMTTLLHLLLLL